MKSQLSIAVGRKDTINKQPEDRPKQSEGSQVREHYQCCSKDIDLEQLSLCL